MTEPNTANDETLRKLAIAAFALAVCIAGWRAASLSAEAPAPSADPLVSILETVSGAGKTRLSISENANGGRTFLVLIDEPGAPADAIDARIESLLRAAAGLNPEAGDRLELQRFPFAAGASSHASAADLIEVAGLVLLAGLAGFIAFAAPRRRPDAEEPARAALAAAEVLEPARPPSVVDLAAEAAARDPKRAAQVIRAWMRGEGGAA
ncbi:MAG: hypothetical protein AAFX03_07995 [Pseudomonadota bacterium]